MFKKSIKLAASLIAVLATLVVSGCNDFENPFPPDTTADATDSQDSADTQADNGQQGTDTTAAPDVQQTADVAQEVTKVVAECAVDTDCNDNNVCTADICGNGAKCVHVPASGTCDDGNACTDNDACKDGKCAGVAKVCTDNNPCTDDFCINGACAHGINTVACDDANACTVGDKCQGGSCQGGAAKDCNDLNPCTTDSCDPNKGCINTPVACEDGDPCTEDKCEPKTGICQFTQKVCDDGKDYTDDWCDSSGWYGEAGQCVYDKKWGACQKDSDCADGDACTQDVCKFGQCQWVSTWCYDGDPCTIDACYPSKGCTNTLKSCNDNNANTTDSCDSQTGACLHMPITTPPTNPPPSGSGTVNVAVNCGTVACEAHLFFGQQANGSAFDNFGLAQANSSFVVDLPKSQLCAWGMEVAARLNTATWPWFGCDAGAPSLTTVTVKVNGVVVTGALTKHPWTCGGGGEGNLAFSKAQLGCP
jgi:hypothetical protein